jgi:(p)ppGpp synthase/HD superfamily hydrolase
MTDVELITKAALYAANAHSRHRRRDLDATPYINHLAEVAYLLASAGCPPQVIAAGYLHDTIEDVEVTREMLTAEFGGEIADLVQSVTDDPTLPKQARKAQQVEHAPLASPETACIKLADKISNLRSLMVAPPHGWANERLKEYAEWADKVATALRDPNPALWEQYLQVRKAIEGRW